MPSNLDFDRWEACRVRLNAYCSSKVAKSSVTCGRVPDPNYRLQAKALIDLFRSICAFGQANWTCSHRPAYRCLSSDSVATLAINLKLFPMN
jgi:hypothetical protein